LNYYVRFEIQDKMGQEKLVEGFNYIVYPDDKILWEKRQQMKKRFYDSTRKRAHKITINVSPNPDIGEESYIG
jgi:hypothetical protein